MRKRDKTCAKATPEEPKRSDFILRCSASMICEDEKAAEQGVVHDVEEDKQQAGRK